jgi:hypothetical protein
LLALRDSVDARLRELNRNDRRAFVLRIDRPVNQLVLRNLLIWQNHVLSSIPGDRNGNVDLLFLLPTQSGDDPRLFDLISTSLMMERVRSCCTFWDADHLNSALPYFIPAAEQSCSHNPGYELLQLPPAIIEQVEREGTRGGMRLLLDGRKRANDFLKAAVPGRLVIAVSLREDADGALETADLGQWLPLIEAVSTRHANAAFVILNRLTPSQWRSWPSHLRFARHQGLSLQDVLCVAQVADAYFGVLDICGLTANAAGRPGVYFPLTRAELQDAEQNQPDATVGAGQIMVASRLPARINAALEELMARVQRAPLLPPRSEESRVGAPSASL